MLLGHYHTDLLPQENRAIVDGVMMLFDDILTKLKENTKRKENFEKVRQIDTTKLCKICLRDIEEV